MTVGCCCAAAAACWASDCCRGVAGTCCAAAAALACAAVIGIIRDIHTQTHTLRKKIGLVWLQHSQRTLGLSVKRVLCLRVQQNKTINPKGVSGVTWMGAAGEVPGCMDDRSCTGPCDASGLVVTTHYFHDEQWSTIAPYSYRPSWYYMLGVQPHAWRHFHYKAPTPSEYEHGSDCCEHH